MELHQTREILEKLDPVLREQGVELTLVTVDEGRVHLRARRLDAEARVAFAVRAVAGTLRRYLPGFREIHLEAVEQDAGSPRPPAGPAFPGLPGLDLAGLSRRQAARALESFAALCRRRGDARFRVLGLHEPEPLQATRAWCALNLVAPSWSHPEGTSAETWILHLDGPCPRPETCGSGEEGLAVPGRILLIDPD